MQAVFDAEWVARLVQGLASPEEFKEETQSFSKILVDKGKELGAGKFCSVSAPKVGY
jgi:hypothetical protein